MQVLDKVPPNMKPVEGARNFWYYLIMTRDEAIKALRQHADAVKSMGATSLYLFGSTARNEATETSDLDLFIDYDGAKKFSLLDLVGIKQFLEDELDVDIDVTTRSSLHRSLKQEIENSAIRVF